MSDFEKQIHNMFDHIWDCDINHPIFDDTVGELMNAVIQCYNNLPSAEPETIVRCKDCKHKYIEEKVWNCPFGLPGGEEFFCSYGARMNGDSE